TVSAWTANTLEALPIAKRIARLGIELITYTSVTGFGDGRVQLVNGLTGAMSELPAASLVTITARRPVDDVFEQLRGRWDEGATLSVTRIGDCLAPSTIQQAVYTGHKWARQLHEELEVLTPRELPMIESGRVRASS